MVRGWYPGQCSAGTPKIMGKWMVGILIFVFGMAYFRTELLVLGKVKQTPSYDFPDCNWGDS